MVQDDALTRIAILGGAFDPPHVGHVEICRYVLAHHPMDEVWVIPCFVHPWAKESAAFSHRSTMCQMALANDDRVRVLDIEKKLGGVSYTVRTLEALHRDFPKMKWYWIIGGDQAGELSRWKELDHVKTLAEFIEVPRGPGSPIPDISSTQIRAAIRQGMPIASALSADILRYIDAHNLYR